MLKYRFDGLEPVSDALGEALLRLPEGPLDLLVELRLPSKGCVREEGGLRTAP